ncbi:helicase HerA-like domain-containing protein [Aquilutibacter rugosus]|uniref:helicase HerA-like domain-containing protein n=1 Tax=Aquilutibacter rugosus TaxID=3115820 RepID=UPI002F3E431F
MDPILLGKSVTTPESGNVYLEPKLGNRHGLIAGATGTGKTVTLMTLVEGFSKIGVPVFIADVKGDVAGLSQAGTPNAKIQERVALLNLTSYSPKASPVTFWDLYGKLGHPVRATVSEVGPTLLSRILELNDTQSGVLDILFKLADDRGLLLMDLADLRAVLNLIAEQRKDISTQYGLVSSQSIGAIQRALLRLESDGGEAFFGEPALELADIMRTTADGRGVVNILAADQLVLKPRLYSSFLLWLMSELFETLPEVGDLDKPKLVFIFDEAHLLFDDAPPALQNRVEQVIRLIRSKGVGVYFCSQYPDDVPDVILGQLGNRVQHALRAFTPRDQKAVKTAADTFVPNPALDVVATISQLGTGEALVSVLKEGGIPSPVERTLIAPPECRLGPVTAAERQQTRDSGSIGAKYDQPLNRESAAERLAVRADTRTATADAPVAASTKNQPAEEKDGGVISDILWGNGRRQGMVESMAKQTARTVGSQIGRQILRGVLGGIFGGSRR